MGRSELRECVVKAHEDRFHVTPHIVSFAPGRVEVLGNHTDYNEGLVLASAVDQGICFALSPADGSRCRALAMDLGEEAEFDVHSPQMTYETPWLNYTSGVLSKLQQHGGFDQAFDATIGGDLPIGAGLSSSGALAVSSVLALSALYGVNVPPLELARICQAAEEEFAGVRCGMLDQVASLFAEEGKLLFMDFRDLSTQQIPMPQDVAFVVCNTHVTHDLLDSEYNLRRQQCDEATAFFKGRLDHPVRALRDVSLQELRRYAGELDQLVARRATHIINENQRVVQAVKRLRDHDMFLFGALMFASHESSMQVFENSSPAQDFVVMQARRLDGVLGARLSGAGFGGNVVVLVLLDHAVAVSEELQKAYRTAHGKPLDVRLVRPAGGAKLLAG